MHICTPNSLTFTTANNVLIKCCKKKWDTSYVPTHLCKYNGFCYKKLSPKYSHYLKGMSLLTTQHGARCQEYLNFIIHHTNIQQNMHTNHHSHLIWGHFYITLCLKGLQFCLTSPPSSLISFLNGGRISQITMLLVRVHPIPSFVPGDRHQRKLVCTYVTGDDQSCSINFIQWRTRTQWTGFGEAGATQIQLTLRFRTNIWL